MVTEQGYNAQQTAEPLGIRTNMLYRWKQQLEDQRSGKSLSEDEGAELKRIREEVKELRMEKEILKKAV